MRIVAIILSVFGLMACSNKEGKKIPPMDFETLDGKHITSEMLEGNATVICVWATWCGDCIREIPELNELVEKYKGNDQVNFIALSDEDEATVNKSLKRFPFNFMHVINAKAYSDQLKTGVVKHFPQVLVVDDNLNIVFEVAENKEKIFSVLDSHITDIIK